MSSTKVKLWTADDYPHRVEAGALTKNDRVKLSEGKIIEANPQLSLSAATTQYAFCYLDRLLESVAYVRMQLSVMLKSKGRTRTQYCGGSHGC